MYRIASVLRIVCRVTATVVTQRSDNPYLTKAVGPISHSPLPIDAPSTITPGPTTPRRRSPFVDGGAGSSARPQGSRPVRASGAASRTSVSAMASP